MRSINVDERKRRTSSWTTGQSETKRVVRDDQMSAMGKRQENGARQRRWKELFGAYICDFFVLGRSLRSGLGITEMAYGHCSRVGDVLCYVSTLGIEVKPGTGL
jgi:hypothetical protein